MAVIKTSNDLIQNGVDYFKSAQPEMDTSVGSVARDCFIEAPATQLSIMYDELADTSSKQSIRANSGSDLDKIGNNFKIIRKSATVSSGVAILTFSSVQSIFSIPANSSIFSKNGALFSVVSGITINPNNINFYRSVASKYQNDLDFLNIKDQYAVEVTVKAVTAGTVGNIGKYFLNRADIPNVTNVTNVVSFNGGTNRENDAAYKERIFAKFSGSSVNTALGYQNAAKAIDSVSDAIVIEPGDPLMTRDGTVSVKNSDGSYTVTSEGQGGAVDVVILGSNLVENTDSFIYRDKSNSNNPADPKNTFVFGQLPNSSNKTIKRKRFEDLKSGILPAQPVSNLLEVTGSRSGSKFVEKSVDSLGRVTGNYEIIKDTGVYAGSPWGFDSFRWISDRISMFQEDASKGQYQGQDNVTFSDVTEIPKVEQNIFITNENSIVTSDRSVIQLLHTPMVSVTRVFNVNTGERYLVTNQNFDNTGDVNLTGRIQISGNTLPSVSDTLQVDYTWIVEYDQYSDYDGKVLTRNVRDVQDSIDWSYSSQVSNEDVSFVKDASSSFYTGVTSNPITTVVKAEEYLQYLGKVSVVQSGIFKDRLCVILSQLPNSTTTVDNIYIRNSNIELFKTDEGNGSFSQNFFITGYVLTIILPTDTVAKENDFVTCILNCTDIFNVSNQIGSSNLNKITIPSTNFSSSATNVKLRVSYIAAVQELLNASITSLPLVRFGNGFASNKFNGLNNFDTNVIIKENLIVAKNLSNQYYVELGLSSINSTLSVGDVLTVIRITDGIYLWHSLSVGSIAINSSNNNYQLVLSGLNTPAIGDQVLVLYYNHDTRKFQPFSYVNYPVSLRLDTLQSDSSGLFTLVSDLKNQTGVGFQIIDEDNTVLFTVNDGVFANTTAKTVEVTSSTFNFSTVNKISYKKIKVYSGQPSNIGVYDIINYNSSLNKITIGNFQDYISLDQLMVIRLSDGKEITNNNCLLSNNRISIVNTTAVQNDKIVVLSFNYKNIRKTPTRLISSVVDQVSNTGLITYKGTSLNKATVIFTQPVSTVYGNSFKLNLYSALQQALGLKSNDVVPSNVGIAKVCKLEKVTTATAISSEVISTLATYDLFNHKLKINHYYSDSVVKDSALKNFEVVLPNTTNNTIKNFDLDHQPKIGDRFRVTFYYYKLNDTESLSYTRNGSLYTNKKFMLIDQVISASGFNKSQSSSLSVVNFTQPLTGSRYSLFYDYLAPKNNERIVLKYNYNKTISDVTLNLELTRGLNADVLCKEATKVGIDVTINIVVLNQANIVPSTVIQNVKDVILSMLNKTTLGGIIDGQDLVNAAYSVDGVDRARIIYFNRAEQTGQVLSVTAQKNEYFAPNLINVNQEYR
jgi:uncharacterized phage protein gp47/JayE